MAGEQMDLTAGRVFARRMKEVRKRRGWTQEELARRLEELGHPIHRVTLAKIERGAGRAQNVTLEEVLAISFALGVSPLHMIVPFDPETRLRVVSKKQAVYAEMARRWLRGEDTLLDEDPRWFFTEIPPEEFEQITRGALEVRPGVPVRLPEFFRRQEMVEEGEAPPIFSEEGEEQ